MKKILSNYDCYKLIRKPTPKPSVRMKSKKDYKRSIWKKQQDWFMTHSDLEQDIWADEIEHDEEPRRSLCRVPDFLSEEEEELSLWASL